MKTLVVLFTLMLLAGLVSGQELTYPKFVATTSGTGWVPLYDHSRDIEDDLLFTRYQFTATSDATFSIWHYSQYLQNWDLLCPKFGTLAADSVLSIANGVTEFYVFDGLKPTGIYVSAGTLTIKAE